MKKKPYIAQFSEYDLSSHAQAVKYADANDRSQHKILKKISIFLLFFMSAILRKSTESNSVNKAIGIIMALLEFWALYGLLETS